MWAGQSSRLLHTHLKANPESQDNILSAVEVLENENRALKDGIRNATGNDGRQAGPADVWTPAAAPIQGGFVEQYGTLGPVPDHDGTHVFKWDDTLWGHEEHFKVCTLC